MNKETLLVKAGNAGHSIGALGAKGVALTGTAGKKAKNGALFTGALIAALGSGVKTGWKDTRSNVKLAEHITTVQSTEIAPHIIRV